MTTQAASHPQSSYRWVVLTAATAAQATASFALLGLAALAGFIQRDFHLTAAETGLLFTAGYAAPTLSLLFVGDLLDRKSERLIIGIGAIILAAALLLAATATSYTALLAWLVVAGLGYSSTQPGGSKSVSAWFRGDRLGLAMGIRQAGLPLGGAIAAAILPAVAAAWSWRAAFVAGAAAALAGGLAFALIYRPPAESADAAPKRAKLTYAVVADLLREPWMRNAMIAGLALVSAQYGILAWLMLYLRDHAQITLTRAAFFLSLAQAAGVIGRVALAAASDRTPGARFAPAHLVDDRGRRRRSRSFICSARHAGVFARAARRLARLLRPRLVRPVGRLSGRDRPTRQNRPHARRRHGAQPARHHRRAAAPRPRPRPHRRLRRALGLRRCGVGGGLWVDGGDAK